MANLGDAVFALHTDASDFTSGMAAAREAASTGTAAISEELTSLSSPFGVLSGLADGFSASLRTVALTTYGLRGVGDLIHGITSELFESNAQFETFSTRMATILGGTKDWANSLGLAKDRMAELTAYSEKTPFRLPDVVQGDILLQNLGGTALATGKNLQLVGDLAATASTNFGEMSRWVGRLYSEIQGGEPFGRASFQLQNLGVLSGEQRAHLEELQKSGASATEMWDYFTTSMAKVAGATDKTSLTLNGLITTLEDRFQRVVREVMAPAFSELKAPMTKLITALYMPPEGQGTNDLKTYLDNLGKSVGKGFGDMLGVVQQAGPEILNFLDNMLNGFKAMNVEQLFENLGPSIKLIGTLFEQGAFGMETFGSYLSIASTVLQEFNPLINDLNQFLREHPGIVQGIVAAWTAFKVINLAGTLGSIVQAWLGLAPATAQQTKLFADAAAEQDRLNTLTVSGVKAADAAVTATARQTAAFEALDRAAQEAANAKAAANVSGPGFITSNTGLSAEEQAAANAQVAQSERDLAAAKEAARQATLSKVQADNDEDSVNRRIAESQGKLQGMLDSLPASLQREAEGFRDAAAELAGYGDTITGTMDSATATFSSLPERMRGWMGETSQALVVLSNSIGEQTRSWTFDFNDFADRGLGEATTKFREQTGTWGETFGAAFSGIAEAKEALMANFTGPLPEAVHTGMGIVITEVEEDAVILEGQFREIHEMEMLMAPQTPGSPAPTDMVRSGMNTIVGIFTGAVPQIKAPVKEIHDTLVESAGDALRSLQSSYGGMATAATDSVAAVKSVLSGISSQFGRADETNVINKLMTVDPDAISSYENAYDKVQLLTDGVSGLKDQLQAAQDGAMPLSDALAEQKDRLSDLQGPLNDVKEQYKDITDKVNGYTQAIKDNKSEFDLAISKKETPLKDRQADIQDQIDAVTDALAGQPKYLGKEKVQTGTTGHPGYETRDKKGNLTEHRSTEKATYKSENIDNPEYDRLEAEKKQLEAEKRNLNAPLRTLASEKRHGDEKFQTQEENNPFKAQQKQLKDQMDTLQNGVTEQNLAVKAAQTALDDYNNSHVKPLREEYERLNSELSNAKSSLSQSTSLIDTAFTGINEAQRKRDEAAKKAEEAQQKQDKADQTAATALGKKTDAIDAATDAAKAYTTAYGNLLNLDTGDRSDDFNNKLKPVDQKKIEEARDNVLNLQNQASQAAADAKLQQDKADQLRGTVAQSVIAADEIDLSTAKTLTLRAQETARQDKANADAITEAQRIKKEIMAGSGPAADAAGANAGHSFGSSFQGNVHIDFKKIMENNLDPSILTSMFVTIAAFKVGGKAISALGEAVGSMFTALKTELPTILSKVPFWDDLAEGFGAVDAGAIGTLATAFSVGVSAFLAGWLTAPKLEKQKGFWGVILKELAGEPQSPADWDTYVWDPFKDMMGATWKAFIKKTHLQGVGKDIAQLFEGNVSGEDFKTFGEQILSSMKDGIISAFKHFNLKDFLKQMVGGDQGLDTPQAKAAAAKDPRNNELFGGLFGSGNKSDQPAPASSRDQSTPTTADALSKALADAHLRASNPLTTGGSDEAKYIEKLIQSAVQPQPKNKDENKTEEKAAGPTIGGNLVNIENYHALAPGDVDRIANRVNQLMHSTQESRRRASGNPNGTGNGVNP